MIGLIEHLQACNNATPQTLTESEWLAILSTFATQNNTNSDFVGETLPFHSADAKKLFINQIYDQVITESDADAKLIFFALWTIRLLLRENVELTRLQQNEFIDVLIEKFTVADEEVRLETLKCIINTCHHSSLLRYHFVNTKGFNTILDFFPEMFFSEDTEKLKQAFFAPRLLFYCTIESSNARKFLQEHSDLLNDLVSFGKKQFDRFKYHENDFIQYKLLFCDILKLLYNITLHHEAEIETSSKFCTTELITWIQEIVILSHHNPSHYDLAKYALQLLMCTPPMFSVYVFSFPQNTIQLDPDAIDALQLRLRVEVLFDVIQLLIIKFDDTESYSDFVVPLLFGLYNAVKFGPRVKNVLYEWIVQNMNWPQRIQVPDEIKSTLKYWKDEQQEGEIQIDKLDAHDIATNLVKAVFIKYMSSVYSNLSQSLNRFLFQLCDDDIDQFGGEFGVGNTIGYLSQEGLLGNILQKQATGGSTLDEYNTNQASNPSVDEIGENKGTKTDKEQEQ